MYGKWAMPIADILPERPVGATAWIPHNSTTDEIKASPNRCPTRWLPCLAAHETPGARWTSSSLAPGSRSLPRG